MCRSVIIVGEFFSNYPPTLNCRSGLGYRISRMKLDPDQDSTWVARQMCNLAKETNAKTTLTQLSRQK